MLFYLITRFLARLWDVPAMLPEGRVFCSIVSFIEIIVAIIFIIATIVEYKTQKDKK